MQSWLDPDETSDEDATSSEGFAAQHGDPEYSTIFGNTILETTFTRRSGSSFGDSQSSEASALAPACNVIEEENRIRQQELSASRHGDFAFSRFMGAQAIHYYARYRDPELQPPAPPMLFTNVQPPLCSNDSTANPFSPDFIGQPASSAQAECKQQ
jgi:hypothetical protein